MALSECCLFYRLLFTFSAETFAVLNGPVAADTDHFMNSQCEHQL